jgi:HlyD family secretion protein
MRLKRAGLAVIMLAALTVAGCDDGNNRMLQGWVEADLIFVSPDEQGRVETLKVREGDQVKKGELLFTVDDDLQQADVVVRKTAVINAQQSFDRAKELLKTAAGTQKTYDDAEAALRQAKANLAWAETRLARRSAVSPDDGTIQQVYYRPGETVAPGRPVVSLLPPANLKIRFFAPEALLPTIRYGESVAVSCDGCASGLSARVTFISSSTEYTPPVIYSLDERAKLVFLIEAHPEHPEKFRVGQPVTVTLPQEAAAKEAPPQKGPQ